MGGVIFDPPVTVEECRLAGRRFGSAWSKTARVSFEQALVARLIALDEALREQDHEEAIVAFDQAAWSGWEAGRLSENEGRELSGEDPPTENQ
jgi:hypothetical protein